MSIQELQSKITSLTRDKTRLEKENERLVNEQKENFMIQSMNDMKKEYDNLQNEITDLENKYLNSVPRLIYKKKCDDYDDLELRKHAAYIAFTGLLTSIQSNVNLSATVRYEYKIILQFLLTLLK